MTRYVCKCGAPLYVGCVRAHRCDSSSTPLPCWIEEAESRQRERICRLLETLASRTQTPAGDAMRAAAESIRRHEDERL